MTSVMPDPKKKEALSDSMKKAITEQVRVELKRYKNKNPLEAVRWTVDIQKTGRIL